jgi:hypothetical protein
MVSKKLDPSPKEFVQLVVLALYWEKWLPHIHKPANGPPMLLKSEWSNVDHILDIVCGLGLLSDTFMRTIRSERRGVPYAHALHFHAAVYTGSHIALNAKHYIAYQMYAHRSSSGPPKGLLRKTKVTLTDKGAKLAPSLEPLFTQYGLTEESYLAESARQALAERSQSAVS